MDVFESPERQSEPEHQREFRIPIIEPLNPLVPCEGTPLDTVEIRTVTVESEIFAVHIAQELLTTCLDNTRTGAGQEIRLQEQKTLFLGIVRNVSRQIYQNTKSETPEHYLRLDKVRVVEQAESAVYLIELLVYRTIHADAGELADQFNAMLRQCLYTPTHEVNAVYFPPVIPIQQDGTRQEFRINQYGEHNTYDKKAEKRATKLLEKMLTKKQFQEYKKEGTVTIEGQSKKLYTIKRNSMITVKPKKGKSYRLCIEPKYHNICPTDEVIAKIRLIQADEIAFHSRANKFDDGSSFIGISGASLSEVGERYSQQQRTYGI